MPLDRANLYGGPAYATWNSATFQMHEDWSVTDNPEEFTCKSNLQGTLDTGLLGVMAEVEFQPIALSSGLSTFLGKIVAPFALGRGSLLFGSTDKPLVIQTQAGKSITFSAAAITGATFNFAPGKPLIERVRMMCLVKNSTALSDAAAFVAVADSAYTEPSLTPLSIVYDQYVTAWGASFTDIETDENGVTFSPELSLTARKTANRGIYNQTVDDVTGTVTFTPEGLSEADWYNTLHRMDGSGAKIGGLRGAFGETLTVTGSAAGMPLLTIPRAFFSKGGVQFNAKGRVSQVTLKASRKDSTGTLQALFTLGVVPEA